MESIDDIVIEIRSSAMRQGRFQLEGIEGLTICRGEQIAIVGANGSGKSILVGVLMGRYPLVDGGGVRYNFPDGASTRLYEKIRLISFRDATMASGQDGEYFYQQRWNSTTLDESPFVGELLAQGGGELTGRVYQILDLDSIVDKRVVMLSSGEMRRFHIARAILATPQIVILDNPFIGLDATTRDKLRLLLGELARDGGVQIILVLSKSDDIPGFITHVIELSNRRVVGKTTIDGYLDKVKQVGESVLPQSCRTIIEQLPQVDRTQREGDVVADLRDVSIRYGERVILRGLNWRVRCGERWALSGDNGSGKSTLLSLICADNPQAYACDISLFGRERGSGESIWDIKRNIGYLSPEMQRAFMRPLPVEDIVGSGLFDTEASIGRRLSDSQRRVCALWMEVFGIESLAGRSYMELSSGEQRLVLLARAFVKDPALLILDEPLHGLDLVNRRRVVEIIECYCERPDRTLIIVSHYPEELPQCITDRLTLLR